MAWLAGLRDSQAMIFSWGFLFKCTALMGVILVLSAKSIKRALLYSQFSMNVVTLPALYVFHLDNEKKLIDVD